jgi:hypothetical protein
MRFGGRPKPSQSVAAARSFLVAWEPRRHHLASQVAVPQGAYAPELLRDSPPTRRVSEVFGLSPRYGAAQATLGELRCEKW